MYVYLDPLLPAALSFIQEGKRRGVQEGEREGEKAGKHILRLERPKKSASRVSDLGVRERIASDIVLFNLSSHS